MIEQIVRYNPDLRKEITDLFRETGRTVTSTATESQKVRTASKAAKGVVPATLDIDRRAQELAKQVVDPAKDPQKYIQTAQKYKDMLLKKGKVLGEAGTATREVTKDTRYAARPYMEYKEANGIVRRLRDLAYDHPIAGKLADVIDGSIDELAKYHGLEDERAKIKQYYKEFKDIENGALLDVHKSLVRDIARRTQVGKALIQEGQGYVGKQTERAIAKLMNKLGADTKAEMVRDAGKWLEQTGKWSKRVPLMWRAIMSGFDQSPEPTKGGV